MKKYYLVSKRLHLHEWLLLGKMSVMLGCLLVMQRFMSMPRLMDAFDGNIVENPKLEIAPDRLVYLVTGLVRVTLRDRFCMKRSLLIFHFLRRWGYDARINFGVVKESDSLQGHAWIDLDGFPMGEREDPRARYAVTYTYPAMPRPGDLNVRLRRR